MWRTLSTTRVAVLALALSGCGGSVCETLQDTIEELSERASACPGISGDYRFSDADLAVCEARYELCPEDRREGVDRYLDCLGEIDECTEEENFKEDVATCNKLVGDFACLE